MTINGKIRWVLAIVVAMFVYYLAFLYYTDPFQIAITRNAFNGKTDIDSVPGWNVAAPWVRVARIDTRPRRVCIPTAARVFNCKLVKFNQSAWREFIAREGFRYYWWYNRISFNWGYPTYRGMPDILRGYAFSGQTFQFIEVLSEYTK